MALESTPDGDELVSAHLAEYQKTRNVRRDPRVAVTILAPDRPGQLTRPTSRSTEPPASSRAARPSFSRSWPSDAGQPTSTSRRAMHPPGLLTRIRIDKVGGIGPWVS